MFIKKIINLSGKLENGVRIRKIEYNQTKIKKKKGMYFTRYKENVQFWTKFIGHFIRRK